MLVVFFVKLLGDEDSVVVLLMFVRLVFLLIWIDIVLVFLLVRGVIDVDFLFFIFVFLYIFLRICWICWVYYCCIWRLLNWEGIGYVGFLYFLGFIRWWLIRNLLWNWGINEVVSLENGERFFWWWFLYFEFVFKIRCRLN